MMAVDNPTAPSSIAWRTRFFIFVQLVFVGLNVVMAQDVHAGGGCAHEGGHVRGNTTMRQVLQVFAESCPGDIVTDVALLCDLVAFHGIVERAHGKPFTENLQGYTLADIALAFAVFDKGFVGPAHHVDETRERRPARLRLFRFYRVNRRDRLFRRFCRR